MEVLYKGEDSTLTMELYADSTRKTKLALVDYNVDVVIYSDGDTYEIYCSTSTENNDVQLTYFDENTIKAVVKSTIIEPCKCGLIKFEVRLENKSDKLKKIRKVNAYILEDCRIKNRKIK